MQVLLYLAEGIFFVLFVATLGQFLRHRDPVSRDVALSFSALAVLFLVSLWRDLGGAAPEVVSALGGGLFVLQPFFTLHLVSLIRRVPPLLLWGGAVLLIAAALPVVVLRVQTPAVTAVAVVAFIGLQAVSAGYLLIEARRREGPGGARMALAAGATGLFAAALLVSMAAGAGLPAEAARQVAVLMAVLAGVGYLLAFLPPRAVREIWQARTTVDYTRDLIARSREPVASIWAQFATMAVRLQAGSAVVIGPDESGSPAVLAMSGIGDEVRDLDLDWNGVEALVRDGPVRSDLPIAGAGPIRARLAAIVDAQFASVVPIAVPDAEHPAALVLLSQRRSLFHASDLELLAALGAQTAIVVERRSVIAQQEALTERLASTVEALRSASAAKSDFVASMSHEFRTPLSAIIGFSELMSTEPHSGSQVTVPVEWVEHIHRGGQHLLALVNDVLDLSKVEAGRLDLQIEALDIASAMAEAVNGLRPLADRKGITIELAATPLTVMADRGRFRQILYNLVSNAIKYTPDGGAIRVVGERSGDEIRVSVTDNGVGIDPKDHASVFEEFRQVGDPEDRQPGTGLGLAVTRRLAQAHGGRMELTSARGEGSTFTFVLPASVAPAVAGTRSRVAERAATTAASEVVSALSASTATGDVLVIEDDPSAVRLLREYLDTAGYTVRIAPTGEAGLRAVAEWRPAAIILDVLLPGIDGWEVLRRLKADVDTQAIPVIIVTVVEEREVGLALGAVDYLVKPIHREALLGCLARYVAAGTGGTGRVLVVDDEPAALSYIRAALEPEGYEVLTVEGGQAALDWARAGQSVDLVVCDLVMPGVDGFEVIAALKSDRRTASVPILVCTAHDLSGEQKARLNGQILGIVSKGQDARVGLLDWLSRAGASQTTSSRPN